MPAYGRGLRAFALPESPPCVDETRRNHEEPTVHGQEGSAPGLRWTPTGDAKRPLAARGQKPVLRAPLPPHLLILKLGGCACAHDKPQLDTTGCRRGRVGAPHVAEHLLTFLMVFARPDRDGADNDAGAVSTYMQAAPVWHASAMDPGCVLPICYFVQEMVARLGIATGKGHAAMIYERFGKWWGRFSLIDLLIVNFLTLVTEFAAISLALSALGVGPGSRCR